MAGAVARAADPASTPQARYDTARQAMQRGAYAEAEAAFVEVAHDTTAPPELQAQALFSVGLMQQNQRRYEAALATYREVQERFPATIVGRRAVEAIAILSEGGSERGLAFRRRFDEALELYARARDQLDREGMRVAGPDLQHAVELMASIVAEFVDHPRRAQAAFELGEMRATVQDYLGARAAYEQALAWTTGTPGDGFITNVTNRLDEAVRARRRQICTRIAMVILAFIVVLFLAARPWAVFDRELLRHVGAFAVGVVVLAVIGETASYVVRTYIDDHSPLHGGIATRLVLFPGVTGEVLALGFLGRCRTLWNGPRAVHVAAALGAIAALAVTTMVVNAYELFPFLDSML